MKYRVIGSSPETRREVSVLSLGTMTFGTIVDEATSFAILDRFAEAGGTFIDTSNNYAFWVNGTQGGESEELVGRWLKSRGVGDEFTIATKLGARPNQPTTGFSLDVEGLSAKVIRESSERSRERLGIEKIHLLYAHIMDENTPLEETVQGFADVVADGVAGLLGASNHWSWRIERARTLAAAAGVPGYEVLQHHHSYLRQRTDIPSLRSPDGNQGLVSGDLLSYLRANPELTQVSYSPLISGAYVRDDKPLGPGFEHAGTEPRLKAVREVAAETGATVNQVVLSWLMGGDIPVLPLVGASSVAQLEENLGAVELELTPEQRAKLDSVN
ncbi:aldo/keto reductase [Streptomyces vietnamensis]|uniref:Oxidoreductase n=1 Tax=Streptomyces vietnamensis TaxID=362257 RepID=A0A0B5IHH3_9ACTN|nr:aldo/keto reductase [Streptomyces vietnamensis]AJF67784.1 oxidoreductase [Streptomyces vietnamensis]